jgi:tRNA(fMet)-specific endonuclease VapC
MILLDTSVLIELFRIKNKHKSFFYSLTERENTFSVSSVTQYEILIGSNNLQDKYWNDFFANVIVLPFDSDCSKAAAAIYKELKMKNKIIELSDLVVAATALPNQLPLATLNVRHFERVKEIQLIKRKE